VENSDDRDLVLDPGAMARADPPRDHAIRAKSKLRPQVWRVIEAEAASGDQSKRPIRICHILQVEGAGDRGLAELAAAQRGVVHRSQLAALGIGRGAVAHRLQIGSLHQILPSVFAVGHPALPALGLEVAALLYVGDDCVLSHATAASVWGLAQLQTGRVEATLAGRHVRERAGLRVHRVPELHSRDVRLRDGVPVTAPARTLIDMAGLVSDDAVADALAQGRVMRLISDRELNAAMARCLIRAGTARLRRVLRDEHEPTLTRSRFERRLISLTDRAQLPRPGVNVMLHGFLVDAVWRAAKLVLELDSYQFHAHRGAFEIDRKRDQTLAAAGYVVVRATWRQLQDEPMATIARIAQALALAEARAGA
jgi:very-short-patch-repair endonuclease